MPSIAADLPAPPATTTRVSVGNDERQSNGGSGGAQNLINAPNNNQAISADGRWVVFASTATNLVPGTRTPFGGIFLRNRETGSTSAIPWVGGGVFPDNVTAAEPAISSDGTVVAFTVIAEGVAMPGAVLLTKQPVPYVLAWDAASGLTQVVSLGVNDLPTPGYQPSVSGDGRYIAYTQWAIAPPPTAPPTTAPTSTPNPGPVLTNLTAAPNGFCQNPTSEIGVDATDPHGIQVVQITYTLPGLAPSGPFNMTYMGGTHWRFLLTPSGSGAGFISYTVTAYDQFGSASSRSNVNDQFDPSYLAISSVC